jgi:CRP-like cAMP-binding protein
MKRTANVIACEICEVYKLDRKAFKKSMESNKELYKKMRTEAKKRYAATKAIEKTFIKSATSLHVRM